MIKTIIKISEMLLGFSIPIGLIGIYVGSISIREFAISFWFMACCILLMKIAEND